MSRQRYWGCPIPVIYYEDGSYRVLDKSELPVLLPYDVNLQSKGNALLNLKSSKALRSDLSSNEVFIIDKEKHQRGRLDDRTKAQKEENFPMYGMTSYNVLEVSELKNKMSEDIRILFTEYRQKRKGNFSSTTRRADDILNNEIN